MKIDSYGARSSLLISLTLCCFAVHAQGGISPPTLVSLIEPDPVENSFGVPLEGWVVVRFSVLADGSTANARAIEAVPQQLSPNEALSAVEEWRFEPATANGQAVQWHNNEAVIVFDNPNAPPQAGPFFSERYNEIQQLLADREFEEALSQNEELLDRSTRLLEIVLGQMQAAIIHLQLDDLYSAYSAIVKATLPEVDVLEPDQLNAALQYRYAIEMQLGNVIDAFDTYDRMEAIAPIPDDDRRAEQARLVREALDQQAPIGVEGRIDREPWRYDLKRRTFAFAEVEGSIRNIDVECDRQTTTLEFSAESEWSLPESWGNCVVAIDGRRGTTFVLMQFE